MTTIPPRVRALLACPRCQGALRDDPPDGLACDRCALRYPVEQGLPVLLAERATPLGPKT